MVEENMWINKQTISSKKTINDNRISVADLTGGGGGRGLGGLNPPPLGCQVKMLMCIEKRHQNMSRPTQYVPIALCLINSGYNGAY